ncbi:MAG: integrase family protein [Rhodocyclales bacterium]|nr:integrase family protein [Rhodocyclales bacterium]
MISDRNIAALEKGKWLAEKAHKGAGRLVVRKTASGSVIFYFRYTRPDGTRDSLSLGYYDRTGKDGYTLIQARDKAGELSRQYRSGTVNLRSPKAGDQRQQPTESVSRQPSAESAIDDPGKSLQALLLGYVTYLEINRKISAPDVKKDIHRYVINPYPDLAAKPAATVETDEFRALLAAIVSRGNGVTARRVRSYLHSAYKRAMAAGNDPSTPEVLKGFGIKSNPIAAIDSLNRYNRAGERALKEWELAHYIRELDCTTDQNIRDALKLALLLGGQRMKQLLRVRAEDVDLVGVDISDPDGNMHRVKTITIYDPKGKRTNPRAHVLPIFGETESIVTKLIERNKEFPTIFGKCTRGPISDSNTSSRVHDISTKLLKEKKIAAKFAFTDLRRTCETLLAQLGIPEGIRAQVLSHGLGGIQSRHYDRHNYLLEKREALDKWAGRIILLCERQGQPSASE